MYSKLVFELTPHIICIFSNYGTYDPFVSNAALKSRALFYFVEKMSDTLAVLYLCARTPMASVHLHLWLLR